MLVLLSSLLGIAVVLWAMWRSFKPLLAVRSARDFAQYVNARNTQLQSGLAIAEVGSNAEARHSHDTAHHRTTLGVRFLATVLTPVLFIVGNSALLGNAGGSIPADLAPWLGLALLGVCIWYLLYIWTYGIEISGDTIRVPTLLFVRRDLSLSELIDLRDTGAYYVRLRFRDGSRAEVLKYVVGREALLADLERRASTQAEDPCQNFQRSKRSGKVSYR